MIYFYEFLSRNQAKEDCSNKEYFVHNACLWCKIKKQQPLGSWFMSLPDRHKANYLLSQNEYS